jgi:hypothetical protein
MKLILICILALAPFYSHAEEKEDLAKMLKESHCIPHRDKDGNVSNVQCDGALGEKMKGGKFQKLQLKSMNKKMEIKTNLPEATPAESNEN